MTFTELKQKDVVNICDGRRIGKPMDLVLNECAAVEALIVPVAGGILGLLKQDRDGCLVPWNRILRIGDDVILVEIHEDEAACEGIERKST